MDLKTTFGLQFRLLVFAQGGSAKAEKFPVDHKVDVLGKAFDQFPRFREWRAAFEGQVPSPSGQLEQLPQCPAHPEILFQTLRGQTSPRLSFVVDRAQTVGRQQDELVHVVTGDFAMRWMIGDIQRGA